MTDKGEEAFLRAYAWSRVKIQRPNASIPDNFSFDKCIIFASYELSTL